ncbi:MAG TPA: CocE/NonD family hydrolase C-terminal non-catalytic domain-containing protein [Actinomycetota bacterium]|nr:CocE/NonD family hydrolase C-terminal non-catalytic domain-containing protein [Actinomycetota bacterium]
MGRHNDRRISVRLVVALALVAAALPFAGGAGAQEVDPLVADSLAALTGLVDATDCKLKDAADADPANGTELPYIHCDDGLPPEGGGSLSIPVPVKYAATGGNDWSGLPSPASVDEVAAASGEDLQPERDNRISLDVNITLPPSRAAQALVGAQVPVIKPPKGGYPVIVLMHGCCGGNKNSWEADKVDAENEKWHHSNAWWAARGYVVVNYTARGFRNADEQGSTGTTQLDSRRYEINDYQYLVGLLADHDAQLRATGAKPLFNINPKKVGAVGGSYGGGFTWLAITDPSWKSPMAKVKMKLAAGVPKYGWTDLVEALVPSGHYFDRDPVTGETFIAPTDPAEALSRNPIGVEKQSIVTGLFASGNLTNGDHTTFPSWLDETYTRLQAGEPYDGDETVEAAANAFLNDRSAYYQQQFWNRVSKGLRLPMYVAATWTDPLFPTMESVRFYNKLKSIDAAYPVSMYLGDYQHFVANKPKEWGDLCGDDHHVCNLEDFRGADSLLNFNKAAARVRVGINSRINRFLDYYLRGAVKKAPKANVSATSTVCAANATDVLKLDEPGIEYRAKSWRELAPSLKTLKWEAGSPIFGSTASGGPDMHAVESDPVARSTQADKCYTTTSNAGPGTVRFEHEPITEPFTMMGIPTWSMTYAANGTDYWVAARMFDIAPNGDQTLVTRGVCRVNTGSNPDRLCDNFDLWGNGWRFEKDHRVMVEITQGDTPMFRRNNLPSSITIEKASLRIPVASETSNVDFRRP